TTTLAEDDVIAMEASRCGAPAVRGSCDDVLSRFILAADTFDLQAIVRATADNPAVDMDAPRRVLDLLMRTRVDHVVERGLPHGCAVEAVDIDALRKAHAAASL